MKSIKSILNYLICVFFIGVFLLYTMSYYLDVFLPEIKGSSRNMSVIIMLVFYGGVLLINSLILTKIIGWSFRKILSYLMIGYLSMTLLMSYMVPIMWLYPIINSITSLLMIISINHLLYNSRLFRWKKS